MADNDPLCVTLIAYYFEEKYYRHAIRCSTEYLRMYSNDAVLQFFKAFGTLMEGRVEEAVRELEHVRDKPNVSLCAAMALIHAHKQSKSVDWTAVSQLESHVKNSRKTADDKTLYLTALVLWFMGFYDKARNYIDRMLKIQNDSREGLILKGWIEVCSDNNLKSNSAIKLFENGLQDSTNVFGLMGKARCFMKKQNFSGAVDVVNQIIGTHPDFFPAHILKMNLFLAQKDWDQTLETAVRIFHQDGHNLKALQMMVVHALAKEGNVMKANEHLHALLNAVELTEPCTPNLHVNVTIPISRLCGNNMELLQTLSQFVERAFGKAPEDAEIAVEAGYLLILQGKYKEAARWYSTALNISGSSVQALTGIIWCQLFDGQVEEAGQQLEFFSEIQHTIGPIPEVVLLQAVIAGKKGAGQEAVHDLLKRTARLHFSTILRLPLGVEYLQKLNPAFLILVVKTHLSLCQTEPRARSQPLSSGLMNSAAILDSLVKITPGFLPAIYLMARVKFLSGDFMSAQVFLTRCLEQDPSVAEFHILQAHIHLCAKDSEKCLQSLEAGISHNFQVRELPQYHLIKARALKAIGCIPEAIQTLKMAMKLPGVKNNMKAKEASMTLSDRASIYLELAKALRLNEQQHEATKVIQDALMTFAGTPEEIRITVANVDLAITKDDINIALTALRRITPDQQHYTEAKEKMAQIYLERWNDKQLYIACYRELSEDLPGPHTSVLLGDAYMKIHKPENAIKVYELGLSKTTGQVHLTCKMGQALMKIHQYNKALSCYEAALESSGHDVLRRDLVQLLRKLKQYEKAQTLINQALNHDAANDLPTLMNDVNYLRILAAVYKECELPVFETLEKAYNIQVKMLRRLLLEKPEAVQEQQLVAFSICCQMAHLKRREKDFEKAVKFYKEALVYSEGDVKVHLEMAQLHLEKGDAESCYQICLSVEKEHKDNVEVAMLIADMLYQKQEYDSAVLHYTQLVKRCPDNYFILVKLIMMLRRTGKLDEAPAHFQMCHSHCQRALQEPGYHFCRGLYCWYRGQANEALMHFNKARKDMEWGEEALCHMVNICLNPDYTIGGEVFDMSQEEEIMGNPSGSNGEVLVQHMRHLGVTTAQNLLNEYHPSTRQGEQRAILLQNCCLVATKEPEQVEKAVQKLTTMASSEMQDNNAACLLALAQAFIVLGHTTRARNQLKRMIKMEWSENNAEELEKSLLLLANIYIKLGKNDVATDLLKRCIHYNKSCCKAFEYLGFIMENEQAYKDAASHYEQAWKHSNKVNPAIGFRLAFNYLKYKKYTEAIDICHKVLTDHPNYPRIEQEILERARLALRP